MSTQLPSASEIAEIIKSLMKLGLDFDAAADLAAISKGFNLKAIEHLIADLREQLEKPLR